LDHQDEQLKALSVSQGGLLVFFVELVLVQVHDRVVVCV
jgi:hypothetical protein